jgi:hypothetical protein
MAGVAFAGVVAGHTLTYFAAFPGSNDRAAYLAATGHSYWRNALVLALLLEVLGLGVVAARGFRAGLRGTLAIQHSGPQLAMRLAMIQVGGFGALEVGERLVSGAGVSGMFAHHLFVLGIAIQLLVAVAGALLLRWLAAAAGAIGASIRGQTPPAPRGALSFPAGLVIPALNVACRATRGRAPPAPEALLKAPGQHALAA